MAKSKKTRKKKLKKTAPAKPQLKLRVVIGNAFVLVIASIVVGGVMVSGSKLIKKGVDKSHVRDFVLPPDYSEEAARLPTAPPLNKLIPPSPSKAPQSTLILPIIMYHYIEYLPSTQNDLKANLNTAPNLLEAQLKSLTSDGYTTYFAKDIPHLLSGEMVLAEKSVVLTFDDGYEDFYTYAFPLLKKYKMKGTNYVISHFINRHGFLTASEVQELGESPYIEIGSHSQTHLDMAQIASKEAVLQIEGSKNELELLLGKSVESFAYPSGKFDEEAQQIVNEAGYTNAVSVIEGQAHSEDKLFYLYRIRAQTLPDYNIGQALKNMPILPK